MALKDFTRPVPPPPTPASERPPGITCEKYTRGEGKRCIHFQQGGMCALPSRHLCSEWTKVNGPNKRALPVVTAALEATPVVTEVPRPAPPARDLFGNPLPEIPPSKSAMKRIPTPPPVGTTSAETTPAVDVDQHRGFTTEDIDSFKALRVEVRLRSEACGDVWLVPSYSGQDRKEITPEHALTLARVLSVFPGSYVVSFEKSKAIPPNQSAESAPEALHDRTAQQSEPVLQPHLPF